MTMEEAGKLPERLQKQEERLMEALANLRKAYNLAIQVGEQLKVTLQSVEKVLDENNH